MVKCLICHELRKTIDFVFRLFLDEISFESGLARTIPGSGNQGGLDYWKDLGLNEQLKIIEGNNSR